MLEAIELVPKYHFKRSTTEAMIWFTVQSEHNVVVAVDFLLTGYNFIKGLMLSFTVRIESNHTGTVVI